MLSHIYIGVVDFGLAYEFYRKLMVELGWREKFHDRSKSWAGWTPAAAMRPLFLIGHPVDGEPAQAGNGHMAAFQVFSREDVRRSYAAAIQSGGTCEGEPGLRPQYHPDYYGAYFRDLDGNKLCVCCHDPEDAGLPGRASNSN